MKKLLVILCVIFSVSVSEAQISISNADTTIDVSIDMISEAFEAQNSPALIVYTQEFKLKGQRRVDLVFVDGHIERFLIETCCDKKIQYIIIYGISGVSSHYHFSVVDNDVFICSTKKDKAEYRLASIKIL